MRAVVFVLTADDKVMYEPVEGPDCLNRAHALRESIEGDFPGSLMCVTGDEAATEDRKDRIFASLGAGRVTPPDDEETQR